MSATLPTIRPAAKPTMKLDEFGRQVVPRLIGQTLSPDAVDKTMIISSLMAQAVRHYEAYDAELQAMHFTAADVLPFLTDAQAEEVAGSANKQDRIMGGVNRLLKEVKKRNQLIIGMLRDTQTQMASASPAAQLRMVNLLREQQGYVALKKLPRNVSEILQTA
ncbi:hypothetical protein [Hymenobacter lapidiphilus]|uniref:Uncharacterized protein n=1 Tax=Hymenobacter lapidiphilus TaxID=2608003 RepID=A0A7Y7PTF3_9BACT|nr:hypothetical protein [Hymenobacter lapidiphilus]NVO33487.1 hypothetical protein [Hymenobacter lapidiphilus]